MTLPRDQAPAGRAPSPDWPPPPREPVAGDTASPLAGFDEAPWRCHPDWCIEVSGTDLELRRVHESLLVVADGHFGTRGTREEGGDGHEPLVMAAGVYRQASDDVPRPLPGPSWYALHLDVGDLAGERRALDLRRGLLYRELPGADGLRAVRFSSLARPGTMASRVVSGVPVDGADPLAVPNLPETTSHRGVDAMVPWVRTEGLGGITAATATARRATDRGIVVDRLAVLRSRPKGAPPADEVVDPLLAARRRGFEALLAEHCEAWEQRWRHARVAIGGDPQLQRAVRFGLFHLMGSVADHGEAVVGARGLSGPAYAGHVFWDADVFVLPFVAATHPAGARAMLEYRIRRLEPARRRARREGRGGARFPWESAHDGTEASPEFTHLFDGTRLEILTGRLEEHIVADVAWAAWCYARWTGDRDFLAGPGGTLLVETARYWASRIDVDRDGSAHLRGVIGPDEYHEDVDDNCFTNVMARWNLRRAAALGLVGPVESEHWRRLAAAIVDGYDEQSGRHEQFAGYWRLDPVMIGDLADPPVAADLLLGRSLVAASQVVKQADVMMAHHLVPDELAPGSLGRDLDFYLPRTAHGSSLSPAIHASLLARADRPDEAVELLRLAARLDLDDVTGTTAGGLHVATMGGVWQALAHGFLGVRPRGEVLRLDPARLPDGWEDLEMCLQFHGDPVTVRLDHRRLHVDGERPVTVQVGDARARTPVRLRRRGDGWQPEGTS